MSRTLSVCTCPRLYPPRLSSVAAAAGIPATGLTQVVEALDKKPRLPVVWFHFQECTCCSESFIHSAQPIVSDIILDSTLLARQIPDMIAVVTICSFAKPTRDIAELQSALQQLVQHLVLIVAERLLNRARHLLWS